MPTEIILQPVTFELPKAGGKGSCSIKGFYAPNTAKTLVLDERTEGDWRVTHLPSRTAIFLHGRLRFGCSSQAAAFAARYFREAVALGAELHSSDVTAGFPTLTPEEKFVFWSRVL